MNSGDRAAQTDSPVLTTIQPAARPSKASLWAGWILTGLTALFMLFDSLGHFVVPPPVTEAFVRLGFPVNRSHMLAIILLLCVILYVIPRTAALGAVLLTGYLGGAVA